MRPDVPGATVFSIEPAFSAEAGLPVNGAAKSAVRLPGITSIAVFLLAAAGTFVAALEYNNRPIPITVIRAELPDEMLRLRVENLADRLQLSWNPQSPAVRTAMSGTLHIRDGNQTMDLPLDATQIAIGSVAYKAVSRDVAFRLELQSKAGPAEAALQVLDGVPSLPVRSTSVRVVLPQPAAEEASAYDDKPAQRAPGSPDDAAAYDDPKPSASSNLVSTATAVDQSTIRPVSSNAAQELPNPAAAIPGVSDYVPPVPSHEVQPDSKNMWPGLVTERTSLSIQVNVNASGQVMAAKILGGQKIPPPLAAASLSAAKQWLFQPARWHGQNVPSQHTIVFMFEPGS